MSKKNWRPYRPTAMPNFNSAGVQFPDLNSLDIWAAMDTLQKMWIGGDNGGVNSAKAMSMLWNKSIMSISIMIIAFFLIGTVFQMYYVYQYGLAQMTMLSTLGMSLLSVIVFIILVLGALVASKFIKTDKKDNDSLMYILSTIWFLIWLIWSFSVVSMITKQHQETNEQKQIEAVVDAAKMSLAKSAEEIGTATGTQTLYLETPEMPETPEIMEVNMDSDLNNTMIE